MSKASPRPPWALTLIALLGAGLSFRAVYNYAEPATGRWAALATALLFDAAMWLSARWYLDTVRARNPLRPAFWLSLALAAATLRVNVAGTAPLSTQWVVHGIGPALFAAFTWIEATIELRKHRTAPGTRERIPLGQKLVHPIRSVRVWLMMIGTGTLSYAQARGMCQNRETQRRIWRTQHGRRWRRRIAPTGLAAYKWGAISAEAFSLSPISDAALVENGVENAAKNAADYTLEGVSEPRECGSRRTPSLIGSSVPVSAERDLDAVSASGDSGASADAHLDQRGWALPADASGRDLDAEQIAELTSRIWLDRAEPAVREIMWAFGISYAKARKALDMIAQPDGAENVGRELLPKVDAPFFGDTTPNTSSMNGRDR